MTYRIYISYAIGDEDNVRELSNSLSQLENKDVYLIEWIQLSGRNIGYKVKEGLDNARAVITLITFNSTNTMWLNQEIGYAFAKNIPIIPIIEKGIDIKGFLEGKEYITFQRGNFKQNIYQIIKRLRVIFPQYSLEQPIKRFQVICPVCNKKFLESVPNQETLDIKVEQDQQLTYPCQFCSTTVYVDPMTLLVKS